MSTSPITPKEKLARLREKLQASRSNSEQAYLADLDDCGVKWSGRYRCNSVGCPRCTRKIISQQQKKARAFFADAYNPDMAFMTVVGPGTQDLDEADDFIEAMDKANRYRVTAGRSSSARWNDFAMFGAFELDAVGAEHVPLLGSERQALLAEVAPVSMRQDGPTWVPTYHALVHVGRLGIIEIQEAFARTWPVPGQVHVKPFETVRSVEANIDKLVSYSLKNSCEITLPKQLPNGQWDKLQVPWPVSWQADYGTWLHQRRNGFEYLRFSISPAFSQNTLSSVVHHHLKYNSGIELEPMPILF
jgi:hypothetical protein